MPPRRRSRWFCQGYMSHLGVKAAPRRDAARLNGYSGNRMLLEQERYYGLGLPD